MAIEAVVFDLGGVLEIVDDAVWPLAWTHRWAGELGMTVEEWTDRMAAYDLAGAVSEAVTRSAYKAGLGLSDAEVAVMFDDLWDRYCGRLDTELMAYVEGSRRRTGWRS